MVRRLNNFRTKTNNRRQVTAVMVTGMCESRYALAQIAMQCFRDQSYASRDLLIINHGHLSLNTGERNIQELRVDKKTDETIGDLRNIALAEAKGDFIINWDDDDWHSPLRIESQLAAQANDAAVVLKNQIRHNLLNSCALYEKTKCGISGTILHPRDVPFQYPSKHRGSDSDFMFKFANRTILDNDPSLYIRFFHGFNLWDAKHIMHRMASPTCYGELNIKEAHKNMLNKILEANSAIYSQFAIKQSKIFIK